VRQSAGLDEFVRLGSRNLQPLGDLHDAQQSRVLHVHGYRESSCGIADTDDADVISYDDGLLLTLYFYECRIHKEVIFY
jgi:hypothetical protein